MNEMEYNKFRYTQLANKEEEDKTFKFMERIAPFAEVRTLDAAKELAKKILPTENELTTFYVGEIKCIVVNRNNLLRISVIAPQSVTCYSFS